MKKNDRAKSLILKYERILSFFYRILGRNHIQIDKGNKLIIGNAFMKGTSIIIRGKGNTVYIEKGITRLNGTKISVNGNNCHVFIGEGSNLCATHLYIEDDNGIIEINKHVTITGSTHFAVIEGTKIRVGEYSLFSSEITLRTGDSHSIISQSTGKRINPSSDIYIGDHVWIGHDVKILKGVNVGNHTIVATGSVLSRGDYPSNCIIGGVGKGEILKTGIDWMPQRINN